MSATILGLDPGLRHTGWAVAKVMPTGGSYKYHASGVIKPSQQLSLPARLAELHTALSEVVSRQLPNYCGIEETFVNKNSYTSLKLSQARGVILAVVALAGIPIKEFSPNMIKKSLTGVGHADKAQIDRMLKMLVGAMPKISSDESDALACAICCGNNLNSFSGNK
jgi:crossover junction endodeoxyribonuclease RuvC